MRFFKTDIFLLYFLNRRNIKNEKNYFFNFLTQSTFIIMGTFVFRNLWCDKKNVIIFFFILFLSLSICLFPCLDTQVIGNLKKVGFEFKISRHTAWYQSSSVCISITKNILGHSASELDVKIRKNILIFKCKLFISYCQ